MVTVTIVVKNGERTLKKVLTSTANFDEVIVLDTGSSDNTLEIASNFPNVRIISEDFKGFGPTRNICASYAKNDWILALDADEVLSCQLAEEILSLNLSDKQVYALPFHNFYKHKQIKWCGWYPEKHVRLYHKKTTSFSEALVHEGVICDELKIVTLNHPVHHYSYDSVSDFLIKMERYSTLFALQYCGKKKATPLTAISHGAFAFLKSYILKGGWKGGYEGLLISSYNAHTAYYKYLKLYEANKAL